jgi:hypothetical protein
MTPPTAKAEARPRGTRSLADSSGRYRVDLLVDFLHPDGRDLDVPELNGVQIAESTTRFGREAGYWRVQPFG